MLILSRRPRQSIVFPTLGISVQVVRVNGQSVRLGVQAPRSLPVLRDELTPPQADADGADRESRHRMRGRLNTLTMALYLAQRQFRGGLLADGDCTLEQALGELHQLEGELTPVAAPERPLPLRTLLVEDNPFESSLLASFLRLNGLDVANASDGQEALDYLARHGPPDAVLLDMRMPRQDGPSTVAAIRANPAWARLKVFAISGARQEDLNVATGPTGVDGWFLKPLNPTRIVEALTAGV